MILTLVEFIDPHFGRVEFMDPEKGGGVGEMRIILRIILMFQLMF
jgi:hypothetical protein